MKKYILMVIGLLFSTYATAYIYNPVTIKVVFAGESKDLSGIVKIESANIACSGESNSAYPNGYVYNGSTYDGNGTLSMNVSGIFFGDHRPICKIYYADGSPFDKVYFTLENIVVLYHKKGLEYKCKIKGVVGTSWDQSTHDNNKLQGEYRNMEEPCVTADENSASNKDTYIITPGHTAWNYDPGQITVNLK